MAYDFDVDRSLKFELPRHDEDNSTSKLGDVLLDEFHREDEARATPGEKRNVAEWNSILENVCILHAPHVTLKVFASALHHKRIKT